MCAKRESASAKKRQASDSSKEFEVQPHETSCIAGLSFVEGVLWQIEALQTDTVWEVAASVLHYMSTIPTKWPKIVAKQSWRVLYERSEQFEKHGVEDILKQSFSLTEDSDTPLYIVDHCCGIIDRDWSAQRLYCDDLFLEMFAEWCNAHLHIYSGSTEGVEGRESAK